MAMDHHPDRKDGDHERMQNIQSAYDILKDPERRARYDTTGSTDAVTPAEVSLGQLVANAVENGNWSGNIVDDMRNQVKCAVRNIRAANFNHRKAIDTFEKRIGRVVGLPIVDAALQSKVEHLTSVIAVNETEATTLEGVLELLVDATDSQGSQPAWSVLGPP